jgi:hypothetical protein
LVTTNPYVIFPTANLLTLARSGWTHVAVVLDAGLGQINYYFNGVAQVAITVGAFHWTGSTLQIGAATGYGPNTLFDIDEFILANRVMSPAEILVLAAAPRAGDAPLGTGQGATLIGNGQRPFLGNVNYGLVLDCNAGAACVVFGRSRCTMAGGTINLPVDLGTLHPWLSGLTGYVDTDLGLQSMIVGGGATSLTFPLPNVAGLSGFPCYGQALALDAATLQFATSNALAIGIGR